ncbi:hypothetical protein RUM43_009931 [Polyplax serrata]|uniref:H15 domain-containing protein n=1 Tax=Polyplax serrata TaxID=468196 RepID=A0AAN8PK16_POLSC
MRPKVVGVKASELVILAIHNLETKRPNESGFTHQTITKYIADKYDVSYGTVKPMIKSALERGLLFGIISQRGGRYQLEDVPEPPLEMPPTEKSSTRSRTRSKVSSPGEKGGKKSVECRKKSKSKTMSRNVRRASKMPRKTQFRLTKLKSPSSSWESLSSHD